MKLDVKVASIDALDAVKARPHQIIQRPRGERDCLGGIENVGSVTLRSPLINQSVHMIIDCMMRNLSTTGAALEVSNQIGVPSKFTLVVPGDGLHLACNVVWRSEYRIGVAFD